MIRKKFTSISITGGLGNQLFQLAAGLYYANNQELFVDIKNASPRISENGLPDICSYDLPSNIVINTNKRKSKLIEKIISYNLRLGLKKQNKRDLIYSKFILLITNVFMSLRFRSLTHTIVNKGVGFSNLKHRLFWNCQLIGYFQTYYFAEKLNAESSLRSLRLKNHDPLVEYYKDLARDECPLIVHVRLGDYLKERHFGTLSEEYYSSAISYIWKMSNFKKIWLFSDDLDSAIIKIPQAFRKYIRSIPEISNSAASTLEVMRFGKGYIIANSTYSWWGAYLAYDERVKVLAPKKWFYGMEDPIKLIPHNWVLILN